MGGASTAPPEQTPLWMAMVDTIARKTLDRPVLGISIALANNDRVVFARGYGFADLARTVPITGETVFHIASICSRVSGLRVTLRPVGSPISEVKSPTRKMTW